MAAGPQVKWTRFAVDNAEKLETFPTKSRGQQLSEHDPEIMRPTKGLATMIDSI
jgi:hypothetical protein